jgi:hypothetical protein
MLFFSSKYNRYIRRFANWGFISKKNITEILGGSLIGALSARKKYENQ